ncbi:MAG: dihydroneopterin aldolase [Candidatus Muirbacterium halophilum]|nr:dihydroneopterin aldolase [Candidatus Muirbacterium halophilum]MCK9475344.1 dihydroneopterin aldolase [Candidatus Muirbacterium halophilum]
MKENYQMKLNDMTFYGYHGTDPSERKIGQRFIINIEFSADLSNAGKSDKIEDTVNYVKLFNKTEKIVKNEKFNLLETLARKIALSILEEHDIISKVNVSVRKPQVPIPGMTGNSEVCIEVER